MHHIQEVSTMSGSKGMSDEKSEWGDFGGTNTNRKSKKIYVDKDSLNERHEESIRNTKHWRSIISANQLVVIVSVGDCPCASDDTDWFST